MARTQRRGHAVKQQKREEATARVAAWRGLTPGQKVASLDGRLGVGVGAVKQRGRLQCAQ